MNITGKTRRQACRRLNDFLTRVMESLWPAIESPLLSPPPPPQLSSGGAGHFGGAGDTGAALRDELRKVNEGLHQAVSSIRMSTVVPMLICVYYVQQRAQHVMRERLARVQNHNDILRARLQNEISKTQVCNNSTLTNYC